MFTILRDHLTRGIAAVNGAIASRASLPVLANILVEAKEDGVHLTATDLDLAISVIVPADVSKPVSLTLPGKKLNELTKELAGGSMTFTFQGDRATIVAGRAKFTLNGLPIDEFPKLPEMDFSNATPVDASILLEMIAKTAFAVSTEESRPILNGIKWEMEKGAATMVATNGHRLARYVTTVAADGSLPEHTIVPRKALAALASVFSGAGEVLVARSANHMGFKMAGATVYTRLIEGPYPNWRAVIPQDNDREAIFGRKEMESALRMASVVANQNTHRVALTFSNGSVAVQAESPDLGEGGNEIDAEYTGEPVSIGFNAAYLIEVLGKLPTSRVKITFKQPERAVMLVPVAEGDENVPQYDCLVMPLRLLE